MKNIKNNLVLFQLKNFNKRLNEINNDIQLFQNLYNKKLSLGEYFKKMLNIIKRFFTKKTINKSYDVNIQNKLQ